MLLAFIDNHIRYIRNFIFNFAMSPKTTAKHEKDETEKWKHSFESASFLPFNTKISGEICTTAENVCAVKVEGVQYSGGCSVGSKTGEHHQYCGGIPSVNRWVRSKAGGHHQ